MTNWILNGQKGSYDFNHNIEYKKCPYCGKDNHKGTYHQGDWIKEYYCGSIIKANWSNDGYTINYDMKCVVEEGTYNGKEVNGRVRI